jgi:hypothetical protein
MIEMPFDFRDKFWVAQLLIRLFEESLQNKEHLSGLHKYQEDIGSTYHNRLILYVLLLEYDGYNRL